MINILFISIFRRSCDIDIEPEAPALVKWAPKAQLLYHKTLKTIENIHWLADIYASSIWLRHCVSRYNGNFLTSATSYNIYFSTYHIFMLLSFFLPLTFNISYTVRWHFCCVWINLCSGNSVCAENCAVCCSTYNLISFCWFDFNDKKIRHNYE